MASEGGLTGFSNSTIDSHSSTDTTSQRDAAKQEFQQAKPSSLEKDQDSKTSESSNTDYGPNARSDHFSKTGSSADSEVGRENSENSENQVPSTGYAPGSQSTTYGKDHKADNVGTEPDNTTSSSNDTASSFADNLYGGSNKSEGDTEEGVTGRQDEEGGTYGSTSSSGGV